MNFHGVRLSGFPGWTVWLVVHITFLNGYGNRAAALWRWGRSMVGSARPERVFSVGHTGGDLSLPEEVRRRVMPSPFPVADAVADQRHAVPGQTSQPATEPLPPSSRLAGTDPPAE